jgi:dTDP-4-amino-4,6-dideoxygalactose transaminase
MALRHQLAAYSPVRPASIAAAFGPLIGRGATGDLEAELAKDFGASEVSLVDSGTHALQLALEVAMRAAGKSPVVAVPGFTCFDVATAIVGAGARVILYDIDPNTLAPDFDSLRRTVNEGATIAVVASLYGIPVPWDQVERVAGDAIIIEDAAQGHGAAWGGKPLGSFGHLSVLSFSRGKGWTGGYGGALLSRDQMLTTHVDLRGVDFKGIGVLAAQWMLGRPALYGVPRALPGLNLGETVYHAPTPIRGMSESAAAALLFNRSAALREAEVRKSNAARLRNSMLGSNGLRPIESSENAMPGYLRLPFIASGSFNSLGDPRAVLRMGVSPSYPVALADLPALQSSIVKRSTTPGARELARTLVTAPTHSLLSEADLSAMDKLLTGVAKRRG